MTVVVNLWAIPNQGIPVPVQAREWIPIANAKNVVDTRMDKFDKGLPQLDHPDGETEWFPIWTLLHYQDTGHACWPSTHAYRNKLPTCQSMHRTQLSKASTARVRTMYHLQWARTHLNFLPSSAHWPRTGFSPSQYTKNNNLRTMKGKCREDVWILNGKKDFVNSGVFLGSSLAWVAGRGSSHLSPSTLHDLRCFWEPVTGKTDTQRSK